MSPLTGVLSEAWDLYKRHAPHFLIIAFVIYLIVAGITALLSLALGRFGGFLGEIVSIFGLFVLQAALVKAVQDVRDGRVDLDLRQTISAAMPSVVPVAIASFFAAIFIGIGFALLIVPGLILVTFLSLIIPAIVIGRATAFTSFGQSWRTVRGNGWHVFGTYVLVFLILIVANIVVGAIFAFLPGIASNFIAAVIVGTIVAPFVALVVTLVYYRLTVAHGADPEPEPEPE